MKIQCKTKRNGGSDITLDDRTYHFRPIDPTDAKSPHIASVQDKAHIARFLSIAEGFEFYAAEDGDGEPDPVRTPIEPVSNDTTEDSDADSEGEDALTELLNDPLEVERATAETAFVFLFDRKPNGNAHTDTIIKYVIEEAAKTGWLADDDNAAEMIASVEAAYAE